MSLCAGGKPAEPDSLGHPREDEPPRLWRRWNITYAAGLNEFRLRTREVEAAYQRSQTSSEPDE